MTIPTSSPDDQGVPDALLAALIKRLTTTTFGRPAESRWLGQVDSTNLIARAVARAGAPEGTLIVAEEQLAGRGRLGRRWQAPY
ncbi:MAG TPA: biotin--[acetyl-CoA-carboxylase] ligase, partial [Chloroflexi bacterium]|nr:biotin--[acetyl-CoA-carboxylase] ligase [Chloroflexota bacterium]